MSPKDIDVLVDAALQARANAYAPLSQYRVGAAVLCGSGKVYRGVNVEFANFTNTIHAEENAIGCAVAAGETEFLAIAVAVGGDSPAWPCGLCRQSIYEISKGRMLVIATAENADRPRFTKIEALIPDGFGLYDIAAGKDS